VGEVEGKKAAAREAQNVGFCAEKDCGCAAGTVGEVESPEAEGIVAAG